jgi:hypothetical protein
LFYLAPDGMLMATPVGPGPTFEFGTPEALFETGLHRTADQRLMNHYAVSRDGTRFLINRRILEPAGDALTALIPW